jgi:hypothetical protein
LLFSASFFPSRIKQLFTYNLLEFKAHSLYDFSFGA